MRAAKSTISVCSFLAAFAALSIPAAADVPHPSGWVASRAAGAAPTVWTDPHAAHQRYKATDQPDNGLTLKELASNVTTDVLLTYRGSKYVTAKLFPPCPGEAGLQIFTVPGAHGARDMLQVAFTVWEGRQKAAYYERPASAKDAGEAIEAMRRTVCSG